MAVLCGARVPRASQAARRAPRRAARAPLRAVAQEGVAVGAKVKVSKSVVVFHVPKTKGAATDLQGMEGTMAGRADEFEGTPTSATLPYKVTFQNVAVDGKTVKFTAHLEDDEFEVVG